METGLKLYVLALGGMLALPFALTQLLFCSSRFNSPRFSRKGIVGFGTVLNLIVNSIAILGSLAFAFQTGRPWSILKRILLLQCSWQDLSSFALTVGICSAFGLLFGLVLRKVFFKEISLSGKGRTAAVCLSLLCVGILLTCFSLSRKETERVFLSEICRKTAAANLNPAEEEIPDDEEREISYVMITNPSVLECALEKVFLSESEDELFALCFENVRIPARGSCRLTMDYAHGLDLEKNGNTDVILSTGGKIIDRVQIPFLAENASWRRDDKSETGEIHEDVRAASAGIAKPLFSRPGGFYSEGFELSITAEEGMTIYYTLDGSDPVIYGLPYTMPLAIEDCTQNENKWSARTDTSAGFLADSSRYTIPDQPVDKCTIVRAVCFNGEGKAGEIASESYFIGFDGRKGYDGIGIISVITDPENLFDDEKGIYVLGNVFRKESKTTAEDPEWWWWPANYHQRGRSWEREASVQFFNRNREMILSKEIGIRIRGGASAGSVLKGLNLYARSAYDRDPFFRADFFENGYYAKRLTLSAGGNNVSWKVKDWLTTFLAGDLKIATTHFLPCCLFLDGEYWGNYWLSEQYDELFFEHTYGISARNVIAIKNEEIKVGSDEDKELYTEMKNYIVKNDLSDPNCYKTASEMIDIESFAAYYALEIYIANHDQGLRQNCIMWRAREKEEADSGDTRWRFALIDVNHPSCYGEANDDTLSRYLGRNKIFRSLMSNADFSNRFYSELKKLATEYFTDEKVEDALSIYLQMMEKPMEQEHRLFNRSITDQSELDAIRSFAHERQEYILNLCAEHDPQAVGGH